MTSRGCLLQHPHPILYQDSSAIHHGAMDITAHASRPLNLGPSIASNLIRTPDTSNHNPTTQPEHTVRSSCSCYGPGNLCTPSLKKTQSKSLLPIRPPLYAYVHLSPPYSSTWNTCHRSMTPQFSSSFILIHDGITAPCSSPPHWLLEMTQVWSSWQYCCPLDCCCGQTLTHLTLTL